MSPKKLICLFVTVIHNCVVKGDVFFFYCRRNIWLKLFDHTTLTHCGNVEWCINTRE